MDRPWLLALLQRLRREAGSDLAFAKVVGYRHSGHVPKLLAADGVLPNVATCLHIAQAAGVHPSDVLRAAGHDEVIPLLEEVYGRRDLSRHTASTDSADAGRPSSRDLELADQLQAAAGLIAGAALALRGEAHPPRVTASPRSRVHRNAG